MTGSALALQLRVGDERVTRTQNVVPMPRTPSTTEVRVPGSTRRPTDVRGYALTVLMGLACIFALQWARPLLVPLVFGILISYALEPIVSRLVQWRIPRGLAAP